MEQNQDQTREGLIKQRSSVSFDDTDETLIEVANAWIQESRSLHDTMLRKQEKNENYYLGMQLDDKKLKDFQAKIILNKIFQTLETIIPRAVENLPAPMASTPETDEPGKEVDYRKYTTQIEETMLAIAEEQDLSMKLKEFLRFHQLYYLGVIKFGYDEDCQSIWVENIRPQRLFIPPYPHGEYVIEFHEATLNCLKEQFPKMAEKLQERFLMENNRQRMSNKLMGTRIGYFEITTEEFKFWKVYDLLLDKQENPHYDFKNKKRNHWKEPKMDYIFSDLFTLGKGHYAQTTLIDQILTLQDAVNKRKRQISDNADRANGVIVAYGAGKVTKEEAAVLEAARQRPDGVVFLENADIGAATHFSGQQLQQFVFDDMVHTIQEIDNLAGTHATTRGEKTPGEETFSGRQLLKESDQLRIGELVRMLERVSEDIYNAFAQLIRIHFKKEQYSVYLSPDGTEKQLKIDDKIIRDGLKIKVRQGTTLAKDKPTLSQEAIVLWQNKALDPITLFERIGDPTPLKTAERFYLWNTQPEKLFQRVHEEYSHATQTEQEQEILQSVIQAGLENKSLLAGQPTPPYAKATSQHLAIHQEVINDPQFAQVSPEVKQAFINHMKPEIQMVQDKLGAQKQQEALSPKDLIDNGGKMPVQS